MNLWTAAVTVFVLNLPFGCWRSRSRRFSPQWFLAVHLPVPAVIALRVFAGLGWHLMTFPVLIGAFFIGQVAGGGLQRLLAVLASSNL